MTTDPLDELQLQPFQERTVRYVHRQMFMNDQKRFLVADEVGLGKTKVAQGVLALATARSRNVVYLASSAQIVGQNLPKLASTHLSPASVQSLCLLADTAHTFQRRIIGLTPIKDLRGDHFGSVQERGMLYRLLRGSNLGFRRDNDLAELFRGRARAGTFQYHADLKVSSDLRRRFLRRLDKDLLAALRDPDHVHRYGRRRQIVGRLRAVLATCALEALNPDVVIVDEIQRFADQLMTDRPSPQVDYLLKKRMLVLSATPYQPNRVGGLDGPDPHKGFLELVSFLNRDDPQRVAEVENAVAAVRALLLADAIDRGQVEEAVSALGEGLRRFMVRTERPSDAHVDRSAVAAALRPEDLKALRNAMRLLARAPRPARNESRRFPELVELWKSAPYVVSALSRDRYVIGRDLDAAGGAERCRPAVLTKGELARRRPLRDPVHPRLRALVQEMAADAIAPRLWLPPTLPYVEQALPAEGPATKTLVFTSWAAAPPAIATAMNLMVEPRPGRPKDLEFSRKNRTSGTHEPVRSVYALGAPLTRFADMADPFLVAHDRGRPLSRKEMVAGIRQQLEDAGAFTVRRSTSRRRSVDLALTINHVTWSNSKIPPEEASYRRPSYELMRQLTQVENPVVSAAEANELAEMATAAPGTCAYRALRRNVEGFSEHNQSAFALAALSIGNSITRLFQRPGAVAVVTASGWNDKGKDPYWRGVLRYCCDHDLQSVLDEYIFLLVSDSGEKAPESLVRSVASTIDDALATVGALQVARPRLEPGSVPRGAMFARALGEHDSSSEEPAGPGRRRRSRRRSSPLLTAFNSPFPPFLLATTSTGQEGLDMHRYCRRLVHWNLPNSPLALEQREGRVDRYLSLGVRTSIAALGYAAAMNGGGSGPCSMANPWAQLIHSARDRTDQHASPLAPLWHFGSSRPIRAIALNIPLSREDAAWPRLLEEASWYRLVLGQPDPGALLDRLSKATAENRREIQGIRVDLSPPE